jgi:hypothetical protein
LVLTEINSNGVIHYVNADGKNVAAPKAGEDDFRQTCIHNLMSIETAKDMWDTEVNKGQGGTPSVSDLKPYFNNSFPTCPDGGVYIINPVGQHPVCSIPGHVYEFPSERKSNVLPFSKNFFLVKDFSEGLAPAIKMNERFCFINTNGEIVLKTSAIDAFPFSEGFARIEAEDGSWGFIDKTGATVIAPEFEKADDFHDGLAIVVSDLGLSEYINGEGKMVFSPDQQVLATLKQEAAAKGADWETVLTANKQEAKLVFKANTCINNLRRIDSAENQWALDNGKMTGSDAPTMDDLKKYLPNGIFPTCPSGGTYTINPVGQNPTCSLGTSVTPNHVLP